MFKTKRKQIKNLRDIQAQSVITGANDYTVGLYNGLELALSVLEDREPEFKTIINEPKIIETKEEAGRTVVSGVRRRTTGG